MDTAPEIDFSSELNAAGELNTVPKIEVTSEIVTSKNGAASETMATSAKGFLDDVSAGTSFEVDVMSNADVASNKIDAVSTERSSDITVPPRGMRRKPYADHSIAALDRSKRERNVEAESEAIVSDAGVLASRDNFCGGARHERNSRESSPVASEESEIRQTFPAEGPPKVKRTEGVFVKTTSEITEEGSSAVEIEKSKPEGASATTGGWRTRVAEGPSSEGLSRIKKRKEKGSLRNSLRRKVDLIERIVEDQMERIWEENMEKHTWLQPIETWIVDHYKPSSNNAFTRCQSIDASNNSTEVNRDPIPKPTYDFKFTAAKGEDEEPKIESRLEDRLTARVDEPRTESKIGEHWQRLRNRAGSSKSDRFEPGSSIAQLNKQDIVSPHVGNGEEGPSVPNDHGVLKVKEIKRHDLLDKLKDNVKEKIEDIHRVEDHKREFF